MPKQNKIRVALAFIFLAIGSSKAYANYLDTLKQCARIGDKTSRIECYEKLGEEVLEQERSEQEALEPEIPAPVALSNEVKPQLPDDYGQSTAVTKAKAKVHRGHVKSCQRAHDKRWFFIFDNDQVWKQVDRKRKSYKNCDFDVSISKDSFGYVMRIDGEKNKIRVRRHR